MNNIESHVHFLFPLLRSWRLLVYYLIPGLGLRWNPSSGILALLLEEGAATLRYRQGRKLLCIWDLYRHLVHALLRAGCYLILFQLHFLVNLWFLIFCTIWLVWVISFHILHDWILLQRSSVNTITLRCSFDAIFLGEDLTLLNRGAEVELSASRPPCFGLFHGSTLLLRNGKTSFILHKRRLLWLMPAGYWFICGSIILDVVDSLISAGLYILISCRLVRFGYMFPLLVLNGYLNASFKIFELSLVWKCEYARLDWVKCLRASACSLTRYVPQDAGAISIIEHTVSSDWERARADYDGVSREDHARHYFSLSAWVLQLSIENELFKVNLLIQTRSVGGSASQA